MGQKIEDLEFDDLVRIEDQRSWVRDHFTPEALNKYEDVNEKLRLLDIILKEKWIEPEETYKLQCLGITFGDILVQELGVKWIIVIDEIDTYERTPALKLEGSTIIIYPLTMISKRIERGEEVDVYKLLQNIKETVKEKKSLYKT
jgi:hypothetical protein